MTALADYAALDAQDKLSQRDAGEIYYNFLKLPLEKQESYTKAWAEQVGVEAPKYGVATGGRPTNGRAQLVMMLYVEHPHMIAVREGRKDSLGGQQVSECIRVYKREAGLTVQRVKPENQQAAGKPSDRQLKNVFMLLWEAADSNEEQDTLIALYEKVGVEAANLEAWTEEWAKSFAGEVAGKLVEDAA